MAELYVPLLAIHNILRWVVIIAALFALYSAFSGLMQRREYTKTDRRAAVIYAGTMGLQLVVGLLLYFGVSPMMSVWMSQIGENFEARYFVMEHIALMLIAVILVHVGTALARRATESRSKFMRSAIWFSLGTIAMLAAIPWWRPLLRLPF